MEVLTVSSIIGPIGFAIAKARDMMAVIRRKGTAWMARRRRLSGGEVCNVMVIGFVMERRSWDEGIRWVNV